MAEDAPKDPFTALRDFVTQWETAANEWGNKVMTTPEAAQAMQIGTATTLKVQQATHEAMAKALSAANMPSKADVEALGARLLAIESQLVRIEAALMGKAPAAEPSRAPAPKRTRKPPPKAK